MKIEVQHEYVNSSRELFDLFCSDGFHEGKFAACGARDISVLEVEESDDTFTIVVEREVPAKVPAILKNLAGEWNRVKQTEVWEDLGDDEFYCELTIVPEGMPLKVNGTMNLTPSDDGCINLIEMQFECGIPLLGKKLAGFAAMDAERTLDKEFDYICEALE